MKCLNSSHSQDRICRFLRNFGFGPALGGAQLCSKGSFLFPASEEIAMSLLLHMGGKLCQQMNHSQRNCRKQPSDERKVGCVSILTYRFQSIGTLLMGSVEHGAYSRTWAETTTYIHTYGVQRKKLLFFSLSTCNIPQGRVSREKAEGPTAKRGNCIWVAFGFPIYTHCIWVPLNRATKPSLWKLINICSLQFPWRLLSYLGEALAVQRASSWAGLAFSEPPSSLLGWIHVEELKEGWGHGGWEMSALLLSAFA